MYSTYHWARLCVHCSFRMFYVLACFSLHCTRVGDFSDALPCWYNAVTKVNGKKVELKFLVYPWCSISDLPKVKRLVCHDIHEKCTCVIFIDKIPCGVGIFVYPRSCM